VFARFDQWLRHSIPHLLCDPQDLVMQVAIHHPGLSALASVRQHDRADPFYHPPKQRNILSGRSPHIPRSASATVFFDFSLRFRNIATSHTGLPAASGSLIRGSCEANDCPGFRNRRIRGRPQLPARSRGATSWANNRMELSTQSTGIWPPTFDSMMMPVRPSSLRSCRSRASTMSGVP
jgi:hypothetical protein